MTFCCQQKLSGAGSRGCQQYMLFTLESAPVECRGARVVGLLAVFAAPGGTARARVLAAGLGGRGARAAVQTRRLGLAPVLDDAARVGGCGSAKEGRESIN